MADANQTEALIAAFRSDHDRVKKEVQKAVVGHESIIDGVLTCLFAGGHCLLEGVPGLGKTLLIRSLSQALQLKFGRIQFTPDLMPADVTGTTIVVETPEGRDFQFRKGPLFAQIVLADEINRATPKTQSALLEAMQERSVSLEGRVSTLSPLFTVFATQNPVESEGTYPLPEAQLDRFLFKIDVGYPSDTEEEAILQAVHRGFDAGDLVAAGVQSAITQAQLLTAREAMKQVAIEAPVLSYVRKLVAATRHSTRIRLGAGPRAGVHLLVASKALAALRGRPFVTPDDVRYLAGPVLKHRLLLSPDAELDGATPAEVLREVMNAVEVPR